MVKVIYRAVKAKEVNTMSNFSAEDWARYRAKMAILHAPGFLISARHHLPDGEGWGLELVKPRHEPKVYLKLTRHMATGQTTTSPYVGVGVEISYSQCVEIDCAKPVTQESIRELIVAVVHDHPRWVQARTTELLQQAGLRW